jgi:hypothetical protein
MWWMLRVVRWDDNDAIIYDPLHMCVSPLMTSMISVCAHFIENGWMNFHEIWCGCYAIRDYYMCIFFNLLHSVILMWWMLKVLRWMDDPRPWHHYPLSSVMTDDIITCDYIYQWSYILFMLLSLNGHYEIFYIASIKILMILLRCGNFIYWFKMKYGSIFECRY